MRTTLIASPPVLAVGQTIVATGGAREELCLATEADRRDRGMRRGPTRAEVRGCTSSTAVAAFWWWRCFGRQDDDLRQAMRCPLMESERRLARHLPKVNLSFKTPDSLCAHKALA